MTLDRPAELFTSYDLGVFCMPEFSAYENAKIQNMIINMSRHICSLFVFHSRKSPVLGFWWHICKSCDPHCHSVVFCIDLCAVSALNFQAIQSEVCISTAKYELSPFF